MNCTHFTFRIYLHEKQAVKKFNFVKKTVHFNNISYIINCDIKIFMRFIKKSLCAYHKALAAIVSMAYHKV